MEQQNEPITRLLDFSLMPIAKVLVMCALGAIMASPRINILTANTRKQLSKLVFTLFLPCLIFTKLGSAVTLQKMLEWWFIPVNVLLATILGCALGWLVAVIIKPPREFFNLTIVMIGVGNIGNIPLVLLGAVCRDDENPFGDPATCNAQSVAYISFGQWVGAVIAYTFVMRMLRPPKGDTTAIQECDLTEPLVIKINGQTAVVNPLEVPVVKDYPQLTAYAEDEWKDPAHNKVQESFMLCQTRTDEKFLATLRSVMQPAINASILALVVGAIPFLKYLFLDDDGALFFLSDALNITGSAMVPCMMLVLGASLAKGPGASSLGMKTTVTITVVRLLVMPAIGLLVVEGADRLSLIPAQNKLFRFVLLLQHSMPSSILAGTVASIQGHGEKEISAVLFWEHICAVFTMTAWLVLFLNHLF
ncbi:hypothetical protein SELMODRAFT_73552 [Selaginella moellendorffii]|uniref:Auxin efflux carrier family protein n=1 Tax=Selaginella moellendorffii TaxID=88036 RepID=D8QQG5_SELML|nr:hypothetical protein SELMODRAFT_73552 [Selaginella moellendorffii]